MKLIELEDISFKYKNDKKNKEILKNISFTIKDRESVVIVGNNGSGKTTLAKIISGLLKPTSGNIILQEELINEKNFKNLYKKISLVFQNPEIQFLGSDVESDLAFGLEIRNIETKIMHKKVLDQLKYFSIHNIKNRKPQSLSGGQKQLVSIASQTITDSRLIIYDEPISMLDNINSEKIIEKIFKIDNAKIILTHNMNLALMCDKLIYLEDSSIKFEGKPSDFFKNIKNYNSHLDTPFAIKNSKKLVNIKKDINIYNYLELWRYLNEN